MKIVVIGASGTIGSYVSSTLEESGHEVIKVGRTSGEFLADIEKVETLMELFKKVGKFDALVNASGNVAFAGLTELTTAQWQYSLNSKLMGQVHLVQQAIPYLNERGSITLISGTLSDDPISKGVLATTVDRAVDGFVLAAACELPKGLRINVVSPTLLEDSVPKFGLFFPGVTPVSGAKVAQAFKKSVMGVQTGQIYQVV